MSLDLSHKFHLLIKAVFDGIQVLFLTGFEGRDDCLSLLLSTIITNALTQLAVFTSLHEHMCIFYSKVIKCVPVTGK